MGNLLNCNGLVAVTILVSLIGCSPSSGTKIVGKWEGQFVSDRVEQFAQAVQEYMGKHAGGETRKMFGALQVTREYLPDGTVVMLSMGEEIKGTWRHLGGDKYRLAWDGQPPIDVTVQFDRPDAFSESDAAGLPNLRFKRK